MTENELLKLLADDEKAAEIVAQVRDGEYALWSHRASLLAAASDERLVLETLLWAVGRILQDLHEHGPEHADMLYEGHGAADFLASKRELEARAAQVEPTSRAGKAVTAARRELPPREHFRALQSDISRARQEGAADRFAAALAEVESISSCHRGPTFSCWSSCWSSRASSKRTRSRPTRAYCTPSSPSPRGATAPASAAV